MGRRRPVARPPSALGTAPPGQDGERLGAQSLRQDRRSRRGTGAEHPETSRVSLRQEKQDHHVAAPGTTCRVLPARPRHLTPRPSSWTEQHNRGQRTGAQKERPGAAHLHNRFLRSRPHTLSPCLASDPAHLQEGRSPRCMGEHRQPATGRRRGLGGRRQVWVGGAWLGHFGRQSWVCGDAGRMGRPSLSAYVNPPLATIYSRPPDGSFRCVCSRFARARAGERGERSGSTLCARLRSDARHARPVSL